MDDLEEAAREAHDDRTIGLELAEVAVECCITEAPRGGEKAGKSPVDRGKRGLKRSTAVDAPEASPSGRWRPRPTATTRRCWPPPSILRRPSEGCPSR